VFQVDGFRSNEPIVYSRVKCALFRLDLSTVLERPWFAESVVILALISFTQSRSSQNEVNERGKVVTTETKVKSGTRVSPAFPDLSTPG
jgi:hypothetical protein